MQRISCLRTSWRVQIVSRLGNVTLIRHVRRSDYSNSSVVRLHPIDYLQSAALLYEARAVETCNPPGQMVAFALCVSFTRSPTFYIPTNPSMAPEVAGHRIRPQRSGFLSRP